jgi:hypothetical protein
MTVKIWSQLPASLGILIQMNANEAARPHCG